MNPEPHSILLEERTHINILKRDSPMSNLICTTTSKSEIREVSLQEPHLPEDHMQCSDWPNSKRKDRSTMSTTSVSTEVVYQDKAEVVLEEMLLDYQEDSMPHTCITS